MVVAKKVPEPAPEPKPVLSKKMAFDYKYIVNDRIVTIPAGTILKGEQLSMVTMSRPDWLIDPNADLPEITDEGVIMDLRLTADEKPAKPKDEDPKDPDKQKKL
jgi:hypothetical protein